MAELPVRAAESADDVLIHLSQHLVSLVLTIRDAKGTRIAITSGIVMSFRDMWWYVTAGHVIQDLEKVEVLSCEIADFFGPDAKVKQCHIFDYNGAVKEKVYRRDLALDVGIVHLRPYHRAHLNDRAGFSCTVFA